jgi:hypothetical protein
MKIDLPPYEERDSAGVQIVIHKWDTWNMDHTLALIIHPMLIQLKETKHGYPNGLTEESWDAILDEMIWAFGEKIKDIGVMEKEDHKRMTRAFKMFGRYYENLWD